jgi:hypothetical protein
MEHFNNMTQEQIDRWLDIQEDKNRALQNISLSIDYLAEAVRGSYDGNTKSAFWGMSQALFLMVGEGENADGSLKVNIVDKK